MHYKNIICLILTLVHLTLSFGQDELRVGSIAPQIDYQKSIPLAYQLPEAKPIVLDFWATWCGPCVAGLLETNEFVERYSDKIDYVAITDGTSSKVESFIQKSKLKQNFIIDTTGKTSERFGVWGIPYTFLIDAKGVIQWGGYGRDITPGLLDEFLVTGLVKTNNVKVENVSLGLGSATGKKAAEEKVRKMEDKKDLGSTLTLSISELPLSDLDYSSKIRFSVDTFEYFLNQRPLKEALIDLFDKQEKRIFYQNVSEETINKQISVNFLASNVDIAKTKMFLINSLATMYSFSVSKRIIDTTVWNVAVVDSSKLNRFRTVMTSKVEGFGAGKYANSSKETNVFTCLNYTVSELAVSLENEYNILCESTEVSAKGYDFFKVKGTNINLIRQELLDKYGISLVPHKKKLEFLIVKGH